MSVVFTHFVCRWRATATNAKDAVRRPAGAGYSLPRMTIIKVEEVQRLGRGGGVVAIPLITRHTRQEENLITTGISSYPIGRARRRTRITATST